MMSRIFTPCS